MRATPIPDEEIWAGAVRRVFSPPGGDLTNPEIAPCEALIDRSPRTGAVNISVRCVLEDGDLERLQAGGVVWLTFWGTMVPWALTVADPTRRADNSRRETWVTTDEHGVERLAVVDYDERGFAQVSREVMTDLFTRAGLRLRLEADPS